MTCLAVSVPGGEDSRGRGAIQYAAAAREEGVQLDVSAMAHLSDFDKGRLVLLLIKVTLSSSKQAAEILSVALTTARRWKHRYEQEGERGLKARYDNLTSVEENGRRRRRKRGAWWRFVFFFCYLLLLFRYF